MSDRDIKPENMRPTDLAAQGVAARTVPLAANYRPSDPDYRQDAERLPPTPEKP